jgi:hypothetical protein
MLVLFSQYLTINNLSSRDYAATAGRIASVLNARTPEAWQAEVDSAFRDRMFVSGVEVSISYDGKKDAKARQEIDSSLIRLVAGNELFKEAYQRYLIDRSDENKQKLKQAVVGFVIERGSLEKDRYTNPPSDANRHEWLQSWEMLLNDTFKQDAFGGLLEEIEGVAPKEVSQGNKIALSELQIDKRANLEVSKALLKYDANSHVGSISEIAKEVSKLLSRVNVGDKALYEKWVDEKLDRLTDKYTTRLSKDGVSLSNLRDILRESFLEARTIVVKNTPSSASQERQHISDLFAEDRRVIRDEIRAYREVEKEGDVKLSVGFYDDLLHLMEFMTSGACTWVDRANQVGRTNEHFGNITLKDESGRFVAVSQVQLLKTGIAGKERKVSEKGYQVMSLPGLYFDSSSSGISREQSFIAICEYAQRKAEEAGMQGVVIPVDPSIHGQNNSDQAVIRSLVQKGLLEEVKLESEVVLSNSPSFLYQSVYLVKIPSSGGCRRIQRGVKRKRIY